MEKRRSDFYCTKRDPYNVVIYGIGNLGINAGRSCFKYLGEKISAHSDFADIPGFIVTYIEKDSLKSKDDIRRIFSCTDLLIDATKRIDFTTYIITNDLIGCLKDEAIILDLTADPYFENTTSLQVKAFEGIPYGTLDKYVFETNAEEYDDIPKAVKTEFRRVTVSCNAWPGIFPEISMKIYEEQLEPFLDVMIKKGYDISINSENSYERSLYRSTMKYFDEHNIRGLVK